MADHGSRSIRPACIAAALLMTAILTTTGRAQQRAQRFDAAQASFSEESRMVDAPAPGLDLITVGKWATLAASVGSGAYGLVAHFDANEKFQRLERICENDPDRCQDRTASGAYADPQLEKIYQDVLALDRAAKFALIASQVSVAGSVILFILDLRESDIPPNIPYEPPRFRFTPTAGGAQLQWRLPAPRW